MQVINLIRELKFSMHEICKKLRLITIVGSSTLIGCLSFMTFKIYLNHRKYRHIPGPPNQGYLIKTFLLKKQLVTISIQFLF